MVSTATVPGVAPVPIALVTGGNRGIGLETAKGLAKAGHRVVLTSRDPSHGREAARAAGDRTEAITLDLADPDSVASLPSRLAEQLGGGEELRVGLLINNGAIYEEGWSAPTHQHHMDVNVLGAVRLVRALRGHLAPAARIVNVSSGYGMYNEVSDRIGSLVRGARDVAEVEALASPGSPLFDPADARMAGTNVPSYKVSKCLLNRYTQILAEDPDLCTLGATVNAICPGWVATRMGGAAAPRSPAQGAGSTLAIALHPDEGMPTGTFTRDGKAIRW